MIKLHLFLSFAATKFEIRHSTTSSFLRENFENATLVEDHHYDPVESAGIPSEPWDVMTPSIHFPPTGPEPHLAYTIGLVMIDDEGKRSEVSNLASFEFQPPPPQIPETTSTHSTTSTPTTNCAPVASSAMATVFITLALCNIQLLY